MKDILSLIFFLILALSVTACQPQNDGDVVQAPEESTFTLNGSGE